MRSHGFTLVELMVTIAVAAILAALAVPSFRDAALGSQLRAVSNDLAASSYAARSEAIKRNAVVRLCSSSNGTTCDGSDWKNGWIILASDRVVQHTQAVPRGFTVLSAGDIKEIRYQPTGFGATAATLTVCRSEPAGREERVVGIEATGKAAIRTTTAGACA